MKHALGAENEASLVHAACSKCPRGVCRFQQRQGEDSNTAACLNARTMLSSSEVRHLAALVMQSKRKLGELHSEVFARIRGACNPYERIGKADFVCRSAPKLAVLDLLFDLVASSAVNGKLRFADVCASPGGFSEYILRRSVQSLAIECIGWGISLVDRNQQGEACAWEIDGVLQKFGVQVTTSSWRREQAKDSQDHEARVPSPAAAVYHVCMGADGTGDLYKPENIEYFVQQEVRAAGGGVQFVDLVVADGGFDYTQRHEIQEAASLKLILCEVLTMFTLLRAGGNFVVKVFDVEERQTQVLLRCLAAHFSTISVVKPVTSRPANSERYVVCESLREMVDAERGALVSRLEAQNAALPIYVDEDVSDTGESSSPSPVEALSLSDDDDPFSTYLAAMNQRLFVHQLFSCMRMLQLVEQEDVLSVSELLDDIHAALTRLYPSCPVSAWDLQLAAPPLPKRFRRFMVNDEDDDDEEGQEENDDDAAACLCGDKVPDVISCCVSCRAPGHVQGDDPCSTITRMITQAVTTTAAREA